MPENVTLQIDGKNYEDWSELELTRAVDTFSTCSFKAPFEPERKEFRETFRPFAFLPLKVLVEGELLFTGTCIDVDFTLAPDEREVKVTGYALPAVLNDCNQPADTVPHEFRKLDLQAIARALAEPYGLGVEFRAPAGAKFEKVKLEEEQTAFAFLVELAQQRNLVISNTPEGVLLCWQSVKAGNPVAVFVEGEQPLVRVSPAFKPQDYFSEVTGFGQKKRRGKPTSWTEKNKWLPGVLRPRSFKLPDTEAADVPEATRAWLGRMFAQMASWTIDEIPTWRSPSEAASEFESSPSTLWTPNTTVKLEAPSAAIYRRGEFLVRSVTLSQDGDQEFATLEVVMLGAFSGEVPDFLPWLEPIGAT